MGILKWLKRVSFKSGKVAVDLDPRMAALIGLAIEAADAYGTIADEWTEHARTKAAALSLRRRCREADPRIGISIEHAETLVRQRLAEGDGT